MQPKVKPSVFDFLDAAQFLQSYFDWRKNLKKSFSITEWSEELDFGSPVTLRFILKRMRRISARSAEVFKRNIFSAEVEGKCFEALVAYSQAKSAEERKAFGTQLIHLHRQQIQTSYKTVDAPIAVRSVFGPLVLTLMTFKDFKKNANSLSGLLRVDVQAIQEILSNFENEKIITKDPEGNYEFPNEILKVPDSPDLRKFYEYWIQRSKEALNFPVESRKYRALNFALSDDEYRKVLEKLDEYAVGLLNQFNNSTFENRTLYMFESSLFPISARLPEFDFPL